MTPHCQPTWPVGLANIIIAFSLGESIIESRKLTLVLCDWIRNYSQRKTAGGVATAPNVVMDTWN